MRSLERNKQTFYYALYTDKAEIIDGTIHTGEYADSYGAWTEMRANISPARGVAEAEVFGADVRYDKVIVTDDINCPIDEYTVLAIDIAPNERQSTSDAPIHDYIVTKKAKSLNVILYAVKKVDVNA